MRPEADRLKMLKDLFLNNLSYKIVSLFVALILWISILGRRDFVTTREMEINLIVSADMSIVSQSQDKVRVKLSGSQPVLKKYKDSLKSIVFDLSDREEGLIDIDIPTSRIDVPSGVRVLSVKPNLIRVEISKNKN